MMKYIAHRGNTKGSNPIRENSPSYCQEALDKGYYVEIDVRIINGRLWSGHDFPQYEISIEFLENQKVYVHAKTIETLYYFRSLYPNVHIFFHDKDDATLTSKGEIWTYPGKQLTPLSIQVMPEWGNEPRRNDILGICSDWFEEN